MVGIRWGAIARNLLESSEKYRSYHSNRVPKIPRFLEKLNSSVRFDINLILLKVVVNTLPTFWKTTKATRFQKQRTLSTRIL